MPLQGTIPLNVSGLLPLMPWTRLRSTFGLCDCWLDEIAFILRRQVDLTEIEDGR